MARGSYETLTLQQYRDLHGPPPTGPVPWWLVSGQPPPPPPRRLVRRSRGDGQEAIAPQAHEQPRRRRLVRVGALREAESGSPT
jgi:hypothetical protein